MEFLSVSVFLLMPGLYGSGVILIRKLRVRREKGHWPTVFILGSAYGIIVFAKTVVKEQASQSNR